MNFLLDTHLFLWWITKYPRLDKKIRSVIENPSHRITASVVSAWEVSLKNRARKLPLKTTLEETFAEPGFEILPITLAHILELHRLPMVHKDPFDRMLIAQARVEKLTLITADRKIWKYRVATMKVNHRD